MAFGVSPKRGIEVTSRRVPTALLIPIFPNVSTYSRALLSSIKEENLQKLLEMYSFKRQYSPPGQANKFQQIIFCSIYARLDCIIQDDFAPAKWRAVDWNRGQIGM
jgi:hypothetical protein